MARGDATPILESAKRTLDEVTTLVKLAVMDNRLFTIGTARNARRHALPGKRLAQPVAVVALVGYQDPGRR